MFPRFMVVMAMHHVPTLKEVILVLVTEHSQETEIIVQVSLYKKHNTDKKVMTSIRNSIYETTVVRVHLMMESHILPHCTTWAVFLAQR